MTAHPAPAASALKHTPLYALHLEMGARMAPFAGYDMPIQYALGVLKEHLHTRVAAGLFDAPRQAVAVLWAHGLKRPEYHQRHRSLPQRGTLSRWPIGKS